jgi:hypothetical protein
MLMATIAALSSPSNRQTVTALADDGMGELEQMLSHARRSADHWYYLLDSFVDDKKLVARIKAKSLR